MKSFSCQTVHHYDMAVSVSDGHISQYSVVISPPRKLRSKNTKVARNIWQKLHKKIGKVAPKLRANLHIF